MDLAEVMRTAGSVRRFSSRPVSLQAVERALDLARFAPSGQNRQPWRVLVVTDARVRAELHGLYELSWRENLLPLITAAGGGRQPVGGGVVDPFVEALRAAPVQLLVYVDRVGITTGVAALDDSHHIGGSAVYPFVQNLLLALRDQGVGATLTTMLVPVEDRVAALVNTPTTYSLAAHLAIGHPAGRFPTRLNRRPVAEFAHLDTFTGPALAHTS